MEQEQRESIADQWNLLAPEKKIKHYQYLQNLAFIQYYSATTEKRIKEMEKLHDFYGMKIMELEKEIQRKPTLWQRMFKRGA